MRILAEEISRYDSVRKIRVGDIVLNNGCIYVVIDKQNFDNIIVRKFQSDTINKLAPEEYIFHRHAIVLVIVCLTPNKWLTWLEDFNNKYYNY